MSRCLHPSDAALAAFRDGKDTADDMRRHVTTCARCRQRLLELAETDAFLDDVTPRLRAASTANGTEPPTSHGTSALTSIDGYELHEEIERGGQGIVYRATHRASGRLAAMKVMRGGATRTRARLEREARLAARLRHPNIVTIHDCGELPDGRFGIAMEWVDGIPLDVWAARIRNDAARDASQRRARLLAVFSKLCDAIAHAHRHGVIHRDLKPTNVLVDADEEPRILDFGIAIESGSSASSRVTITGELTCTLSYAAPEQLAERADLADTRADVYSLGVIAFEMLTGARPHEGPGSVAEFVSRVQSHDPPPVSTVAGRAVAISRDLDTIVGKALARDPDRRYASAANLRDDLNRFLHGDAIEARRDSVVYLLVMALRRHRFVVAATALVCVATLGAAAVATWSLLRASEAGVREAAQRAVSRLESSRMSAIGNILRQVIPPGDPTPMDPESGATHRAMNAVTNSLGAGIFASDPMAEASTHAAIADVSADRGGLRRAEVEYRQALRLIYEADAEESVFGATVKASLARILARRSSVGEASRFIGEAIPTLARLLGPDDAQTVEASIIAAEIDLARGDRPAAIRRLAELRPRIPPDDAALSALELRVRLEASGDDLDPNTRTTLATELLRQSLLAYTDGDERLLASLDTVARCADHPQRAAAEALSISLRRDPFVTAPAGVVSELLRLKAHTLGESHPDLVETYVSLAQLRAGDSRFDEAVPELEAAVAIAIPSGEPSTVNQLELLYALFNARWKSSRPESAFENVEALVEHHRAQLAENAPLHLITRLREIARACAWNGHASRARALSLEAIDRAKALDSNGPHLAWSLIELACVEATLGDLDESLSMCRAGIAMLANSDASWTFHRGIAHARAAHALGAMGRPDDARAEFATAKDLLLRSDLPVQDRDAVFRNIDRDLDQLARGESLDPRM
jgi:tetratricopeptide (TPR) repeat protein